MFLVKDKFIGPYYNPEEQTGGSHAKIDHDYDSADVVVVPVIFSFDPVVKTNDYEAGLGTVDTYPVQHPEVVPICEDVYTC